MMLAWLSKLCVNSVALRPRDSTGGVVAVISLRKAESSEVGVSAGIACVVAGIESMETTSAFS